MCERLRPILSLLRSHRQRGNYVEDTYRVLSFPRDVVIRGEEGQGGFAVPSFSYHDETKKEVKLDNGVTKYVPKYAPLMSFQDVVVQSLLLGYTSLSYNLQTKDRKSTRLNSSHSGESRMPSSA